MPPRRPAAPPPRHAQVDALLPILRRGVHVVLSDVDCVWLHDPNPMVRGQVKGYEDFAHADLIVSTDCHNPESDYDNDGCFGDLLDKNTGVLAVRATPNGIASMAEWRVRLAVGQKDEQDQTTFMDLVDGNGRGLSACRGSEAEAVRQSPPLRPLLPWGLPSPGGRYSVLPRPPGSQGGLVLLGCSAHSVGASSRTDLVRLSGSRCRTRRCLMPYNSE